MNGNKPAYPVMEWVNNAEIYFGMTKREEFAKTAMQGLLANPQKSHHIKFVAQEAVSAADALLTALKEGK